MLEAVLRKVSTSFHEDVSLNCFNEIVTLYVRP